MRPVLVLVLAIAILGGMELLMRFQSTRSAQTDEGLQLIQADGEFKAEIILTFAAGPDQFSLEPEGDAPSVLVQLAGREILRETGEVQGDVPLVIRPIPGLTEGRNEFYVQVSPKDQTQTYRAVGVRVFRDETLLGEKTLLAEPGAIVQGTMMVEIPEVGER